MNNALAAAQSLVRNMPLTPAQQLVFQDPSQIKVVVCPRRWGKDTFMLYTALYEALQGRDVVCFFPRRNLTVNARYILDKAGLFDAPGFSVGNYSILTPNGQLIDLLPFSEIMHRTMPDGSTWLFNEAQDNPYGLRELYPDFIKHHHRAMFLGTPVPHFDDERDQFRESYFAGHYFPNCKSFQFNDGLHEAGVKRAAFYEMGESLYRTQLEAQFVVFSRGYTELPAPPAYLTDGGLK